MRNGVESANRSIRGSQIEDIANADKRAVRGNTFTYIVAAAAVVENLRQIVSFYKTSRSKNNDGENPDLPETYWESPQAEADDVPLTG